MKTIKLSKEIENNWSKYGDLSNATRCELLKKVRKLEQGKLQQFKKDKKDILEIVDKIDFANYLYKIAEKNKGKRVMDMNLEIKKVLKQKIQALNKQEGTK